MTLTIDAVEFGRLWEAAWNRHDVDGVLTHFADHAIFTSPVAQAIGFSHNGVVRGKDALRRYWAAGLKLNPDLRFRVTALYQGIDIIAIAFKNQHDLERLEVLRFSGDLVIEGHGTSVLS